MVICTAPESASEAASSPSSFLVSFCCSRSFESCVTCPLNVDSVFFCIVMEVSSSFASVWAFRSCSFGQMFQFFCCCYMRIYVPDSPVSDAGSTTVAFAVAGCSSTSEVAAAGAGTLGAPE
eukprot:GHVS01004958.1.p3 GENE.GHVS01004958.1~~GHVS01004958.1.p3  ORF type:complete len:121 (+),score=5.14 GHVS01004958.1:1778-2140(+)